MVHGAELRVCDFKSKFLDTPYQDELHFQKNNTRFNSN